MLGESIGLVMEVDVSRTSFCLRVLVDVTKPLRCVLFVDWEGIRGSCYFSMRIFQISAFLWPDRSCGEELLFSGCS